MADDEYLTHGLCPACFCIDFDSPDLSYEPRAIADIVASCRMGCTFCGLLTFSLNLKFCVVDGRDLSSACVRLWRHNENPGAENLDYITAELHGSENWRDPLRPMTVMLDINILLDQGESSQNGETKKQNTFASCENNMM